MSESFGTKLLQDFRKEFKKHADPDIARQKQKYMKSEMPYHGVYSPVMQKVVKTTLQDVLWENAHSWRRSVEVIWDKARFREERYAAMITARHKSKMFQTSDALTLYEYMIVSGAWWDYVDELASHHVGDLVAKHPALKKTMLQWSRADNIWKRRTSIIFQLGWKENTDVALLFKCIEPSLNESEFFLRKGIGWALRQYAWTDPKTVIRYVRGHRDVLSPLSKREALKNVIKSGLIKSIP